ncbi:MULTISPECIES: PAS domain S-box protein [unclassified Erwinia]|uniref:PAS domain-containing sensor histidine kinase n=1 Tax=unclassified Erwinia TaxID=2622719 RepID=UPI00083131F0|nr:PAS domain S-box protein [Erwinia sp. ErVv1]
MLSSEIFSLNVSKISLDARAILPDFALDKVNDAIYLVGQDSRLVYINNKACEMLGYKYQELIRLSYSDVEGELQDPDVAALWWKLSLRPEGIRFTSQHRMKNGEIIPVEVSSSVYEHQGQNLVLCVVRDVRELRQRTERYLQQEQQFRSLVENSPDLIARFDTQMRCQYANPLVLELTGCSEERARGWRLTDSIPFDEVGMRLFRLVSNTLASGEKSEAELEAHYGKRSMVLHVRCVPEYDLKGDIVSVLAVGRDISRLREVENEVRAAHYQLRLLASKQQQQSEDERKHLAREIHDELGQHLTSLRAGLSLIGMQASSPSQVTQQVDYLMTLIDSTIQVVRDVSTRLRPNMLNMGLVPALEWLRDEFVKTSGCSCMLLVPETKPVTLCDRAVTTIFRVVQESLTNISRHAQASKVSIIVQASRDALLIQIRDNGRGFQMQSVRRDAFGLLGIQERMDMLDGQVTINSQPGEGTQLELTLPLPAKKP